MNERITENIIRDAFRNLKYYEDENDIIIEEQKSRISEVKRLLRNANKSGKNGVGYPKFIVSSPSFPDFLIIIDCKADTKYHESKSHNNIASYTVDGVLHYANALSNSFNVIAIAVSGQTIESLKITTLLVSKSSKNGKTLIDENAVPIESIISFDDYMRYAAFDPEVVSNRYSNLMEFSRELHEFMRDHAKLTESEKPLLVSGTLIALKNEVFSKTFDLHKPEKLQQEWMRVIKEEINLADIPNSKKANMTQPYSSIAVHPELGKSSKRYPKGPLNELIRLLNEKVWPFINIYHDFDVVGEFYGEFLKYTGGDKKSLGIVLTPRHITELFAELANLSIFTDKDNVIHADKVLDICTGTGAFLISSMQYLMRKSVTEEQRKFIKESCLIGIEQQPNMYALASSNMILRGDGKANLFQGSCFDEGIIQLVQNHKPNIGMINPPYSQSDEGLHELVFIKQMLDSLESEGIGFAIVPITCATNSHPMKAAILAEHTLEAVMSMPENLFYPVGTVTCIMVFRAHKPHSITNRKTWFGYWKDDGLVKTKHLGRIDLHKKWKHIKNRWVEQYKNRESVPGEAVTHYVTSEDEWCAEAYMDTSFENLNIEDFEKTVQKYALYKMSKNNRLNNDSKSLITVKQSSWKAFRLETLFDIRKGKRLTKANMIPGTTPFIGSTENNNGVTAYIGQEPIHEGNTITVNYNGSVAEAFYQPDAFWASDDVNVLYPKFKMDENIAMYIIAMLKHEKFRYNYGRKWHVERMKNSIIYLPVNNKKDIDFEKIQEFVNSLTYTKFL